MVQPVLVGPAPVPAAVNLISLMVATHGISTQQQSNYNDKSTQ
jgi:hypothetical protein